MLVSCLTCAAPDRPPEFLERCRHYVSRFTGVETEHLVQSGPSMPDNLLTLLPRVRGEYLAIIEDDDWYSPDYLEWMISRLGGIEVVGLAPTVYYHLPAAKFAVLLHPGRSSLFTVVGRTEFLRPRLEVAARETTDPFVDLRLWSRLGSQAGTVLSGAAIGIKHGLGSCLGQGHNPELAFPWSYDTDRRWLKRMVGVDDLQFYLGLVSKYSPQSEMEETT